ncbi:MAG: hypothetical protein IIT65_08485, partial [Lachnospiraceae bacterium]|nr:hypothetical protein [Lachnospiraceae bacterium]
MINFLKIFFPGLMVTGALGSLILNIIVNKQDWPVSLQWLGATFLYTALLFRNKHKGNYGLALAVKEANHIHAAVDGAGALLATVAVDACTS